MAPINQVVNQAAGVATRTIIGQRDDCVVNRRHPWVKFFFKTTGKKTDIGATNGDQRSINSQALVAMLLNNLFKAGSNCQDSFACAGATIEGDNRDLRIKQKFEGEALFFVACAQPPGFWRGLLHQAQFIVATAGECRL